MKRIFVIISILNSIHLNAQTGIGTTTPDPSAKLDITSTNKGFLPPRVALTATNSASPITNPANGLMVFNTVTAGISPYQVVPGYYYWDANGLKWVSLSTTVGNVQNQAIFRSTASTVALNPISTWSSSFNNIASSDMTVGSSTNFTLSNGLYKLEWALPYQNTGTYNDMLMQENISGTWSTFRGSDSYARIANGGSGNWGGGTFAADVVDCSSSSRTFRLYNPDGASRAIYPGVTFVITKLNPSITTSTTADNLGNHIATNNIQLNGNYLSNDGSNKGIRVDNNGNVGIGNNAPSKILDVTGDARVTGVLTSGGNAYPTTTGSSTQVLSTDGAGNLTWSFAPPVGSVISFAGSSAPSGYLLCDGSAVSRTTYANLYLTIGTTYGAGNGSTTFNLPDLRSKMIVGVGQGTGLTNRPLASSGGEESHVLTINEMPAHKHNTTVNSANEVSTIGGYAASSQSMFFGTDRSATTGSYNAAMGNTGGGLSHNVMNPFLALNYIIKY